MRAYLHNRWFSSVPDCPLSRQTSGFGTDHPFRTRRTVEMQFLSQISRDSVLDRNPNQAES